MVIQSEAGCRILIAHFLVYANAMAKNLLGTKNINTAIFSELPLDHPNCPALGPISGKSDFVTAKCVGKFVRAAVWDNDRVNAAENSHRGGET